MRQLKLLDLFCGQGGAAAGYRSAGFEVTGVDTMNYAKRYPGAEFYQEDALTFLAEFGSEYDVIHASPPCQGYSIATAGNPTARDKHQRLIAATRDLLTQVGRPWVIENVEQARSQMIDPVMLCGRMFHLWANDEDGKVLLLDRHRLFESSLPLNVPPHPVHGNEQVAGCYGGSRRSSKPNATPADDRFAARHERHGGYVPRSKQVLQDLLEIDWMTVVGMQQSIPPMYAHYLGLQLRYALESPEGLGFHHGLLDLGVS